MIAAWFYTGGKNPYGYKGLGEISVFIFFGVVATVGSYAVQSNRVTWQFAARFNSSRALACALLAVNNIRDLPKDALVNKRTLAVRLGDRGARVAFISLLAAAISPLLRSPSHRGALPLSCSCRYSIRISRGVWAGAKGAELIPFLGDIGKLHLLVSSTLALALLAKR
jgi:1,4-dihydroxy-2-naphthoate octaprenyltransferase